MTTTPDVRPGQIWESRTRRDQGRQVTIEEVGPIFVIVRHIRRYRIRLNNLEQLYRLVQDVT